MTTCLLASSFPALAWVPLRTKKEWSLRLVLALKFRFSEWPQPHSGTRGFRGTECREELPGPRTRYPRPLGQLSGCLPRSVPPRRPRARPENAARLDERPVNRPGLSQGLGSPAPSTSSSRPSPGSRWSAAEPEPGLGR